MVIFTIDTQKEIETQRHLIKQPEKPVIYIINESAVFEKDGYLYYNLTDSDK